MATRSDLRRMREDINVLRNAARLLVDPRAQARALNDLDDMQKKYALVADEVKDGEKKVSAAMSAQSRAVKAFSGVFDQMAKVATGAFIGIGAALGGITAAVQLFNPAIVQRFTWELRNLGAAFGRMLQPVIEQATKFVIRLNEAITNMSPGAKRLVATISALGASFIMARSAVGLLMPVVAAFGALAGAVITALIAKGAALNIALAGIPAIIGAVVTLFGALATGAVTLGIYGEAFGDMAGSGSGLREISAAFKEIFNTLKPVFKVMMEGFASFSPLFVVAAKGIVFQIKVMIVALGALSLAAAAVGEAFSRMFGGRGGQIAAAWARLQSMLNPQQETGRGNRTFAAGQASWEQVDEAGRRAIAAAFSVGRESEEQQMVRHLDHIDTSTSTMAEEIIAGIVSGLTGGVFGRGVGIHRREPNAAPGFRAPVGG